MFRLRGVADVVRQGRRLVCRLLLDMDRSQVVYHHLASVHNEVADVRVTLVKLYSFLVCDQIVQRIQQLSKAFQAANAAFVDKVSFLKCRNDASGQGLRVIPKQKDVEPLQLYELKNDFLFFDHSLGLKLLAVIDQGVHVMLFIRA